MIFFSKDARLTKLNMKYLTLISQKTQFIRLYTKSDIYRKRACFCVLELKKSVKLKYEEQISSPKTVL